MEEQTNQEQPTPEMRQIIIETDGNRIDLAKNETTGAIELIGILTMLINHLTNHK
jgi:hypothetical protein